MLLGGMAAHRVSITLQPTSRRSLDVSILLEPERQRPRLQLQARSRPLDAALSGDGVQQWSSLSVSVDRKKTRCAECTRPIPETSGSLLCARCSGRTATTTGSSTASPAPLSANGVHANEAVCREEAVDGRQEGGGGTCPPSAAGSAPLTHSWPLGGVVDRVGVGFAIALCVGLGCLSLVMHLVARGRAVGVLRSQRGR